MISEFKELNTLFEEIDTHLRSKTHFYIIGGAMLLYHGIKRSTKEIDVIVNTKHEFEAVEAVLKERRFKVKALPFEYKRLDLSGIFVREDFRIDLFNVTVCKGLSLSDDMVKRAQKIAEYRNLFVSLCSEEDVFLFKTMTEREGDIDDCIALSKRGLDWDAILKEMKHQIRLSGKNVWITLMGERLDLLAERGLTIPIMQEVDKLREEYFDDLEKKQVSR